MLLSHKASFHNSLGEDRLLLKGWMEVWVYNNDTNCLLWCLYPQEPELRGAIKQSLIIIMNRDMQKSLSERGTIEGLWWKCNLE